jgi:glycosyltransferase involved in cell wall biosynthesis
MLVVVPARDEADSIERCVQSLRRAALVVRPLASTDLVVVADRCTDDTTARAARALGRAGIVIRGSFQSVGNARRFGVTVGLRRAPCPGERTWIANTDADTTVPPSWLLTQLHISLRDRAHGVAGVVRLERGPDRTPAIQREFMRTYELRPDGTHPHIHGANLGIRADAYRAAGGWKELATGEDVDLWRRLSVQHKLVHSAALFVRTSARRTGRAPAGFAANLAAHDAAMMESA